MWGKRIAQPLYFRLLQILKYVLGYSCGTSVRLELCLQLPLTYLLLHFCCTSSAIPGTAPLNQFYGICESPSPDELQKNPTSKIRSLLMLIVMVLDFFWMTLNTRRHTHSTMFPTHPHMNACTHAHVCIFPMHASGHLLRQISSSSCPCNPIPVWDMTSI